MIKIRPYSQIISGLIMAVLLILLLVPSNMNAGLNWLLQNKLLTAAIICTTTAIVQFILKGSYHVVLTMYFLTLALALHQYLNAWLSYYTNYLRGLIHG